MTPLPDTLHRVIVADPYDDVPRLIAADWWDEHGEPERAEFVRTQIANPKLGACNVADEPEFGKLSIDIPAFNVIYRRGFPDSITCTLAQWVGGECENCRGRSTIKNCTAFMYSCYEFGDVCTCPDAKEVNCTSCHGTGRVEGIAQRVCEAWPVTGVTLSDKKTILFIILPISKNIGYYFYDESATPEIAGRSILPSVIFNIMWEIASRTQGQVVVQDNGVRSIRFLSEVAALTALSIAAVNYGRGLAGLPPLEVA